MQMQTQTVIIFAIVALVAYDFLLPAVRYWWRVRSHKWADVVLILVVALALWAQGPR
jgi:hypothetical protein